jgi:hypothetical protein
MNSTVYNKLLLQAEEAKDQGMKKLATGILSSLTATPEDESVKYSSSELDEDIYNGMWALAANVIKYYDVNSVNSEKVNEVIETLSSKFIKEIQASLGTDEIVVGPLEPILPGESK